MDVRLVETPGQHGARQVGVAVEIERLAHEQLGDIGIAARSQEVVAASAILVFAVLDRLPRDGQHRAEIGQDRPEPVVAGEVAALQLPGAGRPEALSWVVQVPGVEIDDLRPLNRHHAADLSGSHRPGITTANGHNVLMRQLRPSVSFAIRS